MNISRAFNTLMDFEGGLSNQLADKGGLTKYGISQKAYPDLDIVNLTIDQARVIYEKDYWNKAQCSSLPTSIQYIVFDTAVNMGTATAIKVLQETEGIATDGILGEQTQAMAVNVIPAEYLFHRLLRYIQIVAKDSSQLVFIKGWTARVTRLLEMSRAGKLD